MLIIFKSAASGDVITLEKNGKELLDLLDKDRDALRGIITVAKLPEAITRLHHAIDADAARLANLPAVDVDMDDPDSGVTLHQRGLPLLELLERSLAEKTPVTWGD